MNEIKKEVLELAEKVEAGVDECKNIHKIINILSKAVEARKVEVEFALEMDERLGLEYF